MTSDNNELKQVIFPITLLSNPYLSHHHSFLENTNIMLTGYKIPLSSTPYDLNLIIAVSTYL